MIRQNPDPLRLDAAFDVPFVHRLRFADDALNPADPTLAELFEGQAGQPARALPVVDSGLLAARPDLPGRLRAYADAHAASLQLTGEPHVIPGGERCKNDWSAAEALLRRIADDRIDRQSYVLVLGGGAVLDVAGFAAAVAHRGVRLIRMPSTTLSQADSGVGVKNGINAFDQKNFVGTFAPPAGVVNDLSLLATLDDRRWREGFAEAVKVAVVKDRDLFDRVERDAARIVARDPDASRSVIERSAELHTRHIAEGGDPFETTVARPLDFGHWAGHRLETMTGFRLGHGEAVAIGIAIDCAYAARIGMCDHEAAERVVTLCRTLGFSLHDPALQHVDDLLVGLEQFREHLGGALTITLPRRIGDGRDVHEVDRSVMAEAIASIAARAPVPAGDR